MSKETGKVTHLLYMDDLKLVAPNDEELAEQLKLVKGYPDDIQMEFAIDKCANCTFIQGRQTKTDKIKIDTNATMQEQGNKATKHPINISE